MAESTKGAGYMDPAWTVTGQQETTELDVNGRYVRGVRVSFRTRDGQEGSVFVPDARYNAAAVKAAVEDKAARIAAVAKLSG